MQILVVPDADPVAPAADGGAIARPLLNLIIVTSFLFPVMFIVAVWPDWRRIALVAGLEAIRVAFNMNDKRIIALAGPKAGMPCMLVGHTIINLGMGYLSGWALPFLFYIPFSALIWESAPGGRHGWYAVVSGAVIAGAAWLGGVHPESIVLVVGFSFAIWHFATLRTRLLVGKQCELADALERLRAMQEKMLEQEKLAGLGVLAAGIAHEINNPLSYVTSNISTLMRELPRFTAEPQLVTEYGGDILPSTLDGLARMKTIVSDLRRFARTDLLIKGPVDVRGEVASALRICASQTKAHRICLELGETPQFSGHAQQIVQLAVNLVMNAADATPAGGLLTVRTRGDEHGAELEVEDTGVGIPAANRSRLFEPFFTTKPVGRGTGLGLALVHGIVKAHGGTIEVESEVGKGSRFTVHFPCEASAA